MPRIQPLNESQANEKQKGLLDAVQKKLGAKPNILTTMAQSPATLQSYLAFGEALGGASISGKLREQIALAVAGANGCDYCASAHTAIGAGLGLAKDEAQKNLTGQASDAKAQAALTFSRRIVETRGWVDDADVEAVRTAGFNDGQITEIIATVSLNIFTNYFNHIAQTAIDFPKVQAPEPAFA
jgi:uncharacterized peroxidase-related enzyme